MSQQHAFDGVLETDVPGEFADLADVVEDDAGEQQVPVEDRIMGRDAVRERKQADDVFEQAAQPGMVQLLCGGRFAVRGRDLRVGEQRGQQQLQMGLGERFDKAEQLTPERVHVIGGGGHQVGLVDLDRQRLAQLFHLHLQAVVEAGNAAARLDHVAALEVFGDARVVGLPRAPLQLTGLVAEDQAKVGLVRLGGPMLPGENQEETIEEFAFFKRSQVGYKDVFHSG